MIKTRQGGRAPTNSGAATQIINEVTANSTGQAINGYRETNSSGSTGNQVDCREPSPVAVSTNFYYGAPTAAEADLCWPPSGGGVVIQVSRSGRTATPACRRVLPLAWSSRLASRRPRLRRSGTFLLVLCRAGMRDVLSR